MKKINRALLAFFGMALLTSCGDGSDNTKAIFSYDTNEIQETFGTGTNAEKQDYDAIKVNPTTQKLRDDFAFGVDASMTKVVEENGGIYYNKDGKQQDVFQIFKAAGVNFVRFRLWNCPEVLKYKGSSAPRLYGGGDNDLETDLALAKRAKDAGLNVMIDFHYSDFWADPDQQNCPMAWLTLKDQAAKNTAINEFTTSTLQTFKDNGVHVDAVQIGNETNNGLAGYEIDWNDTDTSYQTMADMFKAGIKGAKSVFSDVRTIIHLANGGSKDVFENYFKAMDKNNVDYDIIGASYYPHISGSLDELQENLNNVTAITNKPVMVVETSWGFTTEYNENTENSYSEADEEVGGYLTSCQAQATELRDVTNVLANVPNNLGLGIFYWEPGWLPVAGACWATKYGQSYQYTGTYMNSSKYADGKATWSNQGLFSYTGKALPSLYTYKYLKEGGKNQAEEKSIKARTTSLSYTLNLAANETLPSTAKVVTDFDAVRERSLVWDSSAIEAVKAKGLHENLHGLLDGKYDVYASAKCIENYVKDPGFEEQPSGDTVSSPWIVDYSTPTGDKVIKLDRKKDIRSGKTDLNWYHSSEDFTFKVHQTITGLPAGKYSLTTYIRGIAFSDTPHTQLDVYIKVNNDNPITLDCANADYLQGWSAGYQTCNISDVEVTDNSTVEVGIIGAAKAKAWAHNDDWELVNTSK